MSEPIKVLDAAGVKVLFDLLSLQDYPNNDVLMAVINAIDNTKADKQDLENIQNQFRNLNEFVKPISAAGMFSDDSALKLTISEMLLNYNKVSLHGLTYYKVSDITPSIAELQNGFNIIVSVAGDAPEDAALDFNRLYYGLEFLPKEIVGETFNTHVTSISTDMIGVYVNQILIVTTDSINLWWRFLVTSHLSCNFCCEVVNFLFDAFALCKTSKACNFDVCTDCLSNVCNITAY